jgi:2-iminobutanoate/2-iminopropanoate deaminase
MAPPVEIFVPPDSPPLIGPYSHIVKVGTAITIGGVGPVTNTGHLAGDDIYSQTVQILRSFDAMLRSVGSDLDHIVHIHVFLKEMADFDRMNEAYVYVIKSHRPARTVIGARELPKPGFRVLMNLTAVTA